MDLPDVLRRLARALKLPGVLYLSFKNGQGEVQRGERRFTDLDEGRLEELLTATGALELADLWMTEDIRHNRGHERWMNAIATKTVTSISQEGDQDRQVVYLGMA